MKKIIAASLAVAVIAIVLFQQCSPSVDDNYGATDALPPVIAPDSWFAADTTPAPDNYGDFLNPDVSDTSFHVWAWQKFLSLTRNNGRAPFENLVQVDNFLNPIGDTILLADSSQAGTHGVLYDKNNRAILYTIHVNQQMFAFQNQYLEIFREIMGRYNTDPKRDSLVQAALVASGYDTLTYPVGCIEVKTSWIPASALSNPQDYYLTTGKVVTAGGTSIQQVALLGMHIVGSVANHPELIWATYEHDGLAPDFPWVDSVAVQDTINTVPSTQDYLFYTGGTTVANCPMNNKSTSPAQFTNVFNMFPLGIARSFRSDSIPSMRDSTNNVNTVSLNASVHAQLENKSGPWKHYFYKGSVWLKVPNDVMHPGNGYIGGLNVAYLRGSRAISNITMETFAQLNFSGNYQTGSMNCFGCHGTADYTNVKVNNDSLSYNLALSHLFKNALGLQVADVSGDSCRNCDVEVKKR